MKVSLKRILTYLGLRSMHSSSQVFVSISVVSAMPRSRLSRHAAKVIIRISIWTCVILVLLFLVTYTLLLAFVDKQMHQTPLEVPFPYKKVRLLNRIYGKNSFKELSVGNKPFHWEKSVSHRKIIWNASVYYSQDVLPLCSKPYVTVLVTSSPEHGDRRIAIRNSWCKSGHVPATNQPWNCIFLVGASNSDEISSQLTREKTLYNDILVGSYIDSYRNLTLKVIHGLHWSTTHCPSSYVVKTDDDCFVNIGLVHEFLLKYNHKTHGLYAGSVIMDKSKLRVVRGVDKRWSVGFEEYPEEYYPPYASGFGYIMSADVVKQLAVESMYVTPVSNEDAYVGIVISRLGISPVSSNRFILSPSGLNVCNYLYVFIVHHVQIAVQAELLQKTLESRTVCNHSAITTWS